jgi:hypothetical protein
VPAHHRRAPFVAIAARKPCPSTVIVNWKTRCDSTVPHCLATCVLAGGSFTQAQ